MAGSNQKKPSTILDTYGMSGREIMATPQAADEKNLAESETRKMGFSISNFKADIFSKGIIKTNHGQLIFTPPPILSEKYDDATGKTREIVTRCEAASIPSVWFTSSEVNRTGYGPLSKIPGQPVFDPYTVTILADRDGDVHRYFSTWMNYIMGFERRDTTKFKFYEQSYRKEYITSLSFKVYDEQGDDILEYALNGAWPQMIQEQQMNWNETDQMVKLVVTFLYTDWSFKNSYEQEEDAVGIASTGFGT